jgi:hypothetical protein
MIHRGRKLNETRDLQCPRSSHKNIRGVSQSILPLIGDCNLNCVSKEKYY